MSEQLLNPADVANILKISQATAYSMLKREMIPTMHIGTLVRVRKADLDQYIRERSEKNTPDSLPKA